MRKRKISIIISPHILEEMASYVGDRGRSQFVERALKNELKRIKQAELIKAYQEAAQEIEEENRFFEGVSGDGLSEAW